MLSKIYLNFTEEYSFKVDKDNIGFTSMTSHYWDLHIQSLIVATWTIKSHAQNLMFYFMQLLDVQIILLSTRLQRTEKGRPMDVQYGTWTDGLNKDVLWTSLGRAMPIGLIALFEIRFKSLFFDVKKRRQCSEVKTIPWDFFQTV